MHMLLEVSDMTTSEVWPSLFIFSIFQQKNATLPNLSFVALFFAKKTGTRKHLGNTEKPPLRMETYPVLFWLVFFKFLRIVFLHLESFMLIKKMKP